VFAPSPATLTYFSGTGSGVTGATVNLTPTNNAALAFATSPILTTGAAATRNSDVITVTSPPAFGSAYTLYAAATPFAPNVSAVQQAPAELGVDINNRFRILRQPGAGNIATDIIDNFIPRASPAISGTWNQGTLGKIAMAGTAGDAAGVFNGGAVATSAPVTVPPVNRVTIGMNIANNNLQINGTVGALGLWATQRVPNSQLQSMTT